MLYQLSYMTIEFWRPIRDLNPDHSVLETGIMPLEQQAEIVEAISLYAGECGLLYDSIKKNGS